MNSIISLRPMMSYPFWIVFLMFMAILTSTIVFYNLFFRKKKVKPEPVKKVTYVPSMSQIEVIKTKYIEKVSALEEAFANDNIESRECFQRLSGTIREFVFEVTGVDATTFTLEDIRSFNNKKLTNLIQSYYEPEFAPDAALEMSEARIKALTNKAINNTKVVIQKWN